MMGRREKIEHFDRIKTETQQEIAAVRESGGNVQFIFDYHRYLNELRSVGDQPPVALAGKKFRPRAVQIAAVSAMKDMVAMSKSDPSLAFEADVSDRLTTAARAAYVSAAGHFEKDALATLPEPGPDAIARKQKAAMDWDRLILRDPDSLISISLFGHEIKHTTPMPAVDHVKGIGSILFLILLAFGAYYVWQSR